MRWEKGERGWEVGRGEEVEETGSVDVGKKQTQREREGDCFFRELSTRSGYSCLHMYTAYYKEARYK